MPRALFVALVACVLAAGCKGSNKVEGTVQFAAATASVGEADGTASIGVTLTADKTLKHPVTVQVFDEETGTAFPGTDYTAITPITLTFPSGSTSGTTETATVTIDDNTVIDGDRTIVLGLQAPTRASLGDVSTETVTIVDNDHQVAFAQDASTVAENAGPATIDVTLATSHPLDAAVTVDVADAGTGTATSGTDYQPVATTVTFPAGSQDGDTESASVDIVDDALPELDETVDLVLQNPSGATLGTPSTHTLTITDNDPLHASVAFTTDTLSGEEGNTVNVVVELTSDGPLRADTTVDVVDLGTGTATSGSDYTGLDATVTFPYGSEDGTTETVPIVLVADGVPEADETVDIALENPGSGFSLGDITTQTLTIVDPTVVTPVATDDTFSTPGNTALTVDAASGLLANDSGNLLSVTASDSTSSEGGSVTVNADGSFTYVPAAGDRNPDSFGYTVTNVRGSDTGTVTITPGTMVWYVDDAAGAGGDGTSVAPFASISDYDANATPASGDVIYLATGSADYDGELTLLDSQSLVGEGEALVVDSLSLRAAGTRPVLTSSTGDAVTLGSNDTVTGLDVGDTPNGYAFYAPGDVGDLSISGVSVSGSGNVIILSGSSANASVTFDSVSSDAAPSFAAIDLDNYAGHFTVTGNTTITGPSQTGISVQTAMNTSSLVFGDVSVSGYTTNALNLDGDDGSVTLGDVTIGASDATGVTQAIEVYLVNDLVAGNVSIDGATGRGIRIRAQAEGSTVTFGDYTTTADTGREALLMTNDAGAVTFGAYSANAQDGYWGFRSTGSTSTSSVTFDSFTSASTDALRVIGDGAWDFGATDVGGSVYIDADQGAGTYTFKGLTIDSADYGLAAMNGPNATVVLQGTTSITDTGTDTTYGALDLDDVQGDDGAGGGWMFDTVDSTGGAPITLSALHDDVTFTGAVSVVGAPAGLVLVDPGGHTITFDGPTTFGTSQNPVGTAVSFSGDASSSTLVLGDLTVNATAGGLVASSCGTLGFTGTAPIIDGGAGPAVDLDGCTPLNGTWTFGALTSSGSATDNDAGVAIRNVTGNAVFGDIDVSSMTGASPRGVLVDSVTGNVAFSGTVQVSGLTADTPQGIRISNLTGAATFGKAVTVQDLTGTSPEAILLDGVSGTVTFSDAVTIASLSGDGGVGLHVHQGSAQIVGTGDVSVTDVAGTGDYGIFLESPGADVALQGALSISGTTSDAVRVQGATDRALTFGGTATIDGQGLVFDSSPGASITFPDLHMTPDSGVNAVNTRGDSAASNSGMSLVLGAATAGAGIAYPQGDGNATAIFGDTLASLIVQGTVDTPFKLTDVGTGTTDGGNANIQDGPHGIYCSECGAVLVDHVAVDSTSGLGDTTTAGYEDAVMVTNDSQVASSVSILDSKLTGVVDGDAVYVYNGAAGQPTIAVDGNVLGGDPTRNDGRFEVSLETGGTQASADISVLRNTLQNSGSITTLSAGGILLTLDAGSGSGGAGPVLAQIGDGTTPNANALKGVFGNGIELRVGGGAKAVVSIDDNALTAPPDALLDNDPAFLVDTTGASSADVTVANNTLDACYAILASIVDGSRSQGSEARVDLNGNTFTDCQYANVTLQASNGLWDGSTEQGVADFTLRYNDFGANSGSISTTVDDGSLGRLEIDHNTSVDQINLLAATTGSRFVFGDLVGDLATDSVTSGDLVTLLTDSGHNDNAAAGGIQLVNDVTGDASIVDQNGSSAIALPATP